MSYLAEQNVIGALLIDKNSIKHVYGRLEPEMFTSQFLATAYLEFLRGYENGFDVNLVTIAEKIKSAGIEEDIVLSGLKECVSQTASSVEIKSYADIIIRDYKAARLGEIINMIRPSADDINSQIGNLITDLENLKGQTKSKSKSLAEITRENKGKYFCENKETKLYLGFSRIDDMLGGLEGGDMIVIGARPAVGKSALVTQITTNLAKSGKRIGFYNLEMQEKQMYERFVSSLSGIGMTRLRRAIRFLGDEKERFNAANETLERQENIIISTGSRSVGEITAESRHMGYDIIMIDYLQLLRADKTYTGNRYAEVGAISKAIKSLAMSLNIPIIALSQLNRVSELRETKEPTMSELREAGDIEQDASVIMLMWNISDDDRSQKGFKIEKQRQGMTGKVMLQFDGDLMMFRESDNSVEEAKKLANAIDSDCPF